MTKAKAKRYAAVLERMASAHSECLATGLLTLSYSPAALRWERDFYNKLAVELRLLSEGKRLPQKRKAVK